MLQHYRELLSAYVDGELTPQERKTVLRLLRRSGEARVLLRQMKEDSQKLQGLPRRTGPDFTRRILDALARLPKPEPKLEPAPAPEPAPAVLRFPFHLPSWAATAAAAAVLAVVGLTVFALFFNKPDGPQVVKNNPQPETPREDERRPFPAPGPEMVVQGPSIPEKELDKLQGKAPTPLAQWELFTSQSQLPPLLGLNLKLRELEPAPLLKPLKAEVEKRDHAVRVELVCKDGGKALDRLETALTGQQVGLVVEEMAQYRRRQTALKTNFVLYLEDFTPEELVGLLERLRDDDVAAENKRKGDGQFDGLKATSLSEADRQQLTVLLGTHAGLLNASRPAATQRLALALPYNPSRPLPNSTEVKRFLENRRPARAGTLQVLLVLRNAE